MLNNFGEDVEIRETCTLLVYKNTKVEKKWKKKNFPLFLVEMQIDTTTWKRVQKFLKKLKIELPYDSATPLLSIYPEKTKTLIWKNTHTSMFSAVLL